MLLSNDFDRTNPLGFGLTQVENALDGIPTQPVPTNPEGTGLETMLQEIIDKIEAGGGGDCKVTDVQIDGVSIVSGKVATIPIGSPSVAGVVKPAGATYGIAYQTSGNISTAAATEADIDAATNDYKPITPAKLDYTFSKYGTFIATWGTTTYDEIKAAREAGRLVICNDSKNNTAVLASIDSSFCRFYRYDGDTLSKILCSNANQWSLGTTQIGNQTISSASTHAQVPTNKGVYNFVNNKAEQFTFTTSGGQIITKNIVCM